MCLFATKQTIDVTVWLDPGHVWCGPYGKKVRSLGSLNLDAELKSLVVSFCLHNSIWINLRTLFDFSEALKMAIMSTS